MSRIRRVKIDTHGSGGGGRPKRAKVWRSRLTRNARGVTRNRRGETNVAGTLPERGSLEV